MDETCFLPFAFFSIFYNVTFVQSKKIKTFITKILNFEAEKTFYKPKITCLGHYTSLVFPKRKKKFHIQPGCIITQVLKEILSRFRGQRNIKWSSDRPEQTGSLDNTNTPDISIKVNFNSLDY